MISGDIMQLKVESVLPVNTQKVLTVIDLPCTSIGFQPVKMKFGFCSFILLTPVVIIVQKTQSG